jgi:hypothetical protein
MKTTTVWKTIEKAPRYEVSNDGQVRSRLRGNVLKPSKRPHGYLNASLRIADYISKGFYVHRLVAMAFLGNPSNRKEVNHKDGNPANNHVSNLEWVTRKQNMKDAFKRNGNWLAPFVGQNKQAYVAIDPKTGFRVRFASVAAITDYFGKPYKTLAPMIARSVKTGWGVYGYKWERV